MSEPMTDLLTRLESSEGSDHQLTIDICEKLDLAPKEYFGSPVVSYSWDSGVINTEKARHLDALRPPPILPQWDDPDLETDIGQCPDCSGDGCDDEPVSKPGRSDLWLKGRRP